MKLSKIAAAAVLGAMMLTSCKEDTPKYVFFMIGDGMGINQAYATQIYNEAKGYENPQPNFLSFPVRTFFTTNCTTSRVTDSAAAGTALATGEKTYYGAMGVNEAKEPIQTIAEKAMAAGYGAGVVTSVGVNHATPAAFYAHTESRNDYDAIANQLFASNLDFAAGSGFNTERKVKKTGDDYVEDAKAAGWEVYLGKDAFASLNSTGKVLCMSEDPKSTSLKYAIDQTEADTKLTDFTSAAVEHLYKNHKNGFFLMVEGGNIDHSAHDNDGATTFEDVNDFARAIDVVLEFYRQHPKQTLIIVTADHETGGLMLGSGHYYMNEDRLTHQTVSEGVLSSKLRALAQQPVAPAWDEVKGVLSECLGLWSEVEVDPKAEAHFKDLYDQTYTRKKDVSVNAWYSSHTALASDAVEYVNNAAGFGWSFEPHSGSPVGLYVIGAGAEAFMAAGDNSDVPQIIATVAKYQ